MNDLILNKRYFCKASNFDSIYFERKQKNVKQS